MESHHGFIHFLNQQPCHVKESHFDTVRAGSTPVRDGKLSANHQYEALTTKQSQVSWL
jgi:hypothetical protein